jgi:hypothetical protein
MPDNVLESDDDNVPVIIGTRNSRRQTNWRYRDDALSQVDQAYLNNLLSSQESQYHAIQISMLFMTTIFINFTTSTESLIIILTSSWLIG